MKKSKVLTRLLMCFVLVIALTGCGTVPTGGTQDTSAQVQYAGSWLQAFQNMVPATSQTVSAICANSTSKECSYAQLGAGLMPLILGGAQAALSAFKSDPTPATEAALSTAMIPVYDAAKKLNTNP